MKQDIPVQRWAQRWGLCELAFSPFINFSFNRYLCLHISKVLEKGCCFAQNSTKFNFVKLVELTNSSPFKFLHVGLINFCICPNVCSVVTTDPNESMSQLKIVGVRSALCEGWQSIVFLIIKLVIHTAKKYLSMKHINHQLGWDSLTLEHTYLAFLISIFTV